MVVFQTVTFSNTNPGTYNYNYDNIGNLIADKSEQISQITCTLYNKVKEIIKG